jgi:hypothetical protein
MHRPHQKTPLSRPVSGPGRLFITSALMVNLTTLVIVTLRRVPPQWARRNGRAPWPPRIRPTWAAALLAALLLCTDVPLRYHPEVAARLDMLIIACGQRNQHDRPRVERLVADHRSEFLIPAALPVPAIVPASVWSSPIATIRPVPAAVGKDTSLPDCLKPATNSGIRAAPMSFAIHEA